MQYQYTYTTESSVVESFPIAIVVAQFNRKITKAMQDGAIEHLIKRGFKEKDITVLEVPGAMEIPLIAKRLAVQKRFKAIIAMGAVIRGETSHYDLVCESTSEGCQRVALDYDIPVVFSLLTTENEAQAWDRLGGKYGHKGVDSANCAISMHALLSNMEALHNK